MIVLLVFTCLSFGFVFGFIVCAVLATNREAKQ